MSVYRHEYWKWTSTRTVEELERWKDDVWEGVFLRVKESQSSLALQWYTEFIALLTRVVIVLSWPGCDFVYTCKLGLFVYCFERSS